MAADLIITKLERDRAGHWRCNVSVSGSTFPVHRKFGSWMHEFQGTRRSVYPSVASSIQAKVRKLEKAERREAIAA